MPKYYCDYCDTYLTHDSPSVRKTHCTGRKHKENVKLYYDKWLADQVQLLNDGTNGFPNGAPMMGGPMMMGPGPMGPGPMGPGPMLGGIHPPPLGGPMPMGGPPPMGSGPMGLGGSMGTPMLSAPGTMLGSSQLMR